MEASPLDPRHIQQQGCRLEVRMAVRHTDRAGRCQRAPHKANHATCAKRFRLIWVVSLNSRDEQIGNDGHNM